MAAAKKSDTIVTFPSSLGWFALIGCGNVLKQLRFGHPSQQAALEALSPGPHSAAEIGNWNRPLVRRLQAYAEGARDDFRDVEIDPGPQSAFQRRVARACRRIAYGRTLTYGQLAAKATSPGAARAVGQCMAANDVPLVVPCHRVVASNGRLGGFSAYGGIAVKRRLLELEGDDNVE